MPRKSRTVAPADTAATLTPAAIYNTAIYARLSSEGKNKDKESDSIDNQIYLISQYIEERPYLKLCATFTDYGETGTNFNREGFNAMMDEVKAGKINCIVVKDLSRFGRNYIETGEYLEKIFPFMGVRFISISDGLDNHDANSNTDALIVSLKNLINDVYAKDISQKIISALRTMQQKGDYVGGLPPFGYKKSEENHLKLVVDNETAPIVRDIFKWKAEGLGDTVIAKRLNDMGIPSPLKRRVDRGEVKKPGRTKLFIWRDKTIQIITTNPLYIGHMVQGRRRQALCDNMPLQTMPKSEWIVVENTHEGIVDKATFEKAQEMRYKNTKDFYRNYDKSKHMTGEKHLFKGLLICGDCGSKLTRKHNTKIPGTYTFICSVRYKSLTDCVAKNVSEAYLHDAALLSIQMQVAAAVDLTAMVERLNKASAKGKSKNSIAKDMSKLQNDLKRLTNLKAALYESYADNLLTEDEYIYSKDRYTKQIDKVRARLEGLQDESVMKSETLTPQNKWLQAIMRFKDQGELTHEMVNTLISRVIVRSNTDFEFIWNFKSDKQALCIYTGVDYSSMANCFHTADHSPMQEGVAI